jgi:hypothetical protein
MQKAGFRNSDSGPFVGELRELMARREADGLVSTSPGTWADGPFWEIDPEVRARELLAVEWSMKHGHSYRVECLDPPIHWQYNARTGRRRLVVGWTRIPIWVGDRWRELGMHYRVWRDRKLVNPYRDAA